MLNVINVSLPPILISKQPIPSLPPGSIVHSKLDYCNSLYYNLPYSQKLLLQIQNCLVRAVFFKAPSSLTPLLFLNLYTGSKSISILSIKFFLLRIKFLLLLNLAILRNLISVDSPHIETRSSSSVTLSRPLSFSSLKITDRSFRYASPCLWNKLPASFRFPTT